MPRANGRWVLAFVAVWVTTGGGATAADPPERVAETGGSHPPLAKTGEPGGSRPPLTTPPVEVSPHAEAPLKDLTPPGFADLIPPDEHGHGHNHKPAHGPAAHDHDDEEGHGHLAPPHPGFYSAVEGLALRPRREAFDYVLCNATPGLAVAGPVESLNYEIRGGVRAELGYRLKSGWEVFAGYTYFRSGAQGAVIAGPGQALFPTLTRPGLTDSVTAAQAEANLEYNVYDVAVGRRLLVDDHFSARVIGGLRFASIRQDLTAVYDGGDARRAVVSAPTRFDGFGPVVGAEGVAAGWRGFHLFARASGGLLTGRAQNPLSETNDAGRSAYVGTRYDLRKVVPVAGVGVGGGWQYRTFSLRVGYEITHYFNLTDQPRLADDVGRGAVVTRPAGLSLEGLFAQVGLNF